MSNNAWHLVDKKHIEVWTGQCIYLCGVHFLYISMLWTKVVRNESQHVGSHNLTCHNISIVLRSYLRTVFSLFCSVSFVFFVFCHFSSVFLCFIAWFLYFLSNISVFMLGSPVFLYFPYIFLSILSTTYRSYLRTVLCSSCLRSFTGRPILRRNSFLTTLLWTTHITYPYYKSPHVNDA